MFPCAYFKVCDRKPQPAKRYLHTLLRCDGTAIAIGGAGLHAHYVDDPDGISLLYCAPVCPGIAGVAAGGDHTVLLYETGGEIVCGSAPGAASRVQRLAADAFVRLMLTALRKLLSWA